MISKNADSNDECETFFKKERRKGRENRKKLKKEGKKRKEKKTNHRVKLEIQNSGIEAETTESKTVWK